jgi:hypothetical protein
VTREKANIKGGSQGRKRKIHFRGVEWSGQWGKVEKAGKAEGKEE